MPRAVDRFTPEPEGDPNRSGTEFHMARLAKDQIEIWQAILQAAVESIKAAVIEFIKFVTTIDLTNEETFLMSLAELILNGGEKVDQLVEAILGAITTIPAGLINGVLDLLNIPNLPASQITSGVFGVGRIPDITRAMSSDMQAVIDAVYQAIHGGSAINNTVASVKAALQSIPAGNIIGLLLGNIAQYISIGNIGLEPVELLANPTYNGSDSVDGGGIWQWDGTQTHTADGSGSVKIIANGADNELLSDPAFPVHEDQVLQVSHWLKWAGVTAGPGVSFSLGLSFYDAAGTLTSSPVVDQISSVGANSSWVQFSGSYTVPSGVATARLRLTVTDHVTGGTVHWDDGSVKATSLMPQGFIQNLTSDLGARALAADLVDLLETLGLGSSSLAVIADRFANLGIGGVFDAQFLANIAHIPLLPAGSIPLLDATKIATGTLASGVIPTITSAMTSGLAALDNLANALGMAGSGFLNTDVQAALAAQAAVTAANSAAIQELQNHNTGQGYSGTNVFQNFATYSSQSGGITGFASVNSGTNTGISGGQAALLSGSVGMLRWTADQTLTDYQVVNGVFPAWPGSTYLSNDSGKQILIGRCNSAGTSYVYGSVGRYEVEIHRVASGVDTIVASTTLASDDYLPGAIHSLVCGIPGNVNGYQVQQNGAPLLAWNDSGGSAAVGASNRFCGFGFYKDGGYATSPCASFGFADNSPQSIVGCVFRQYRASTGTASVSPADAAQLLPNSFYDTNAYNSGGFTFTGGSNNRVQVPVSGIYMVRVNYVFNATQSANTWFSVGAALYRNGSLYDIGHCAGFGGGGSASSWSIGDTFILPLNAGDYVNPGVFFDRSGTATAGTVNGEATGTRAYFEVALVNTSIQG